MRMATALIAATSLALVLVAAVVVPMLLTPGTYGFSDWPEASTPAPGEQVVAVDVPARRPLRAERTPRRVTPAPAPPAAQQFAQAAPNASGGTRQAAPVTAQPAEPQAAREAPPEPTVIEARPEVPLAEHLVEHVIEPDLGLDGTNQR